MAIEIVQAMHDRAIMRAMMRLHAVVAALALRLDGYGHQQMLPL